MKDMRQCTKRCQKMLSAFSGAITTATIDYNNLRKWDCYILPVSIILLGIYRCLSTGLALDLTIFSLDSLKNANANLPHVKIDKMLLLVVHKASKITSN